jgi:hypothetical protein
MSDTAAGTAAKKVLDDFDKDIGRVEQLLRLIYIFRDFAGQAAPESVEPALELYEAAQGARTDLPVLSGSLLLYLCGRFEYFVRELVGTIVDDLVDKAATYEDLPGQLRKEVLSRTLQINLNPRKFNHTEESASTLAAQLADNLSGRIDAGASMFVDSSTVTITESNMRPDVLSDLFKRIGIGGLWDTLGKQLALKSLLDEATEDGCKKAAVARLDDIMSERNKVAHPIGDVVFPDAALVEEMARYFKSLAQVLLELALAPR